MEVHRQSLGVDARVQEGGDDAAHVGGPGHADGVADTDLVDAKLEQLTGDADHGGFADLALVRAPEGGADVATAPPAALVRSLDDRAEGGDRLRDRHVDIGPRELLGGGREDGDGLDAGCLGALEAALVRHQHRVADTCPPFEASHQLVGVGQLRDRRGRDEAGGLDLAQPRVGQEPDERQLVVGADRRLLVLETVARTDLVDPNVVSHEQ